MLLFMPHHGGSHFAHIEVGSLVLSEWATKAFQTLWALAIDETKSYGH